MLKTIAVVTACGLAVAAHAAEQTFPTKPIRFIVPTATGGGSDPLARALGTKYSTAWGQQVVVDNRPGAGMTIGIDLVAKASPDGHTMVLVNPSHAINATLMTKLPYDAIRDLTPVTVIATQPLVMVVSQSLPVKNVRELIALAKAKPRTLSYSSVGNASQGHLAAELFAAMAGVELNHIPYKTSTHAVIDLNEGRIDMQFGILGSSLALIREGKLRALAVTTPQRLEDVPDVQTMIEAGLPGYDVSLVFAVVMPAGTPRPIVARLNREIGEFVTTPELKRVLAAQAIQAVSSTPDELRERIAKEIALWRGIAQKAGIKPE